MRTARLAIVLVLLAMGGGAASARTAAVPLSLRAVVNPVPAGLCTAPYYRCQTYLNPTWSFTSDDLRYQGQNGLFSHATPCVVLHTDLGEFGGFSIASGGDSSAAPPGAPIQGGAWRVWCYGFLPKQVTDGDKAINLLLNSPAGKLGTATVDIWLVRYQQLPNFAAATMARATLKVQFGGGTAPVPTPTTTTPVPTSGKLSLDWEMPPRFGTKADVTPTTWPVIVKTSVCAPGQGFLFTVDSKFVQPESLGGCRFVFRFPRLGSYRVSAANVTGGGTASTTVQVRDFLIAGLGDSAASGEGVPDVAAANGQPPTWQFARCDRSNLGFQPQAAKGIEDGDKRTSVTFVHLACSGAGIATGEVAPYWGIAPGDAREPLRAQLDDLKDLIGKRKLDAILISIGINDLGFGHIVEYCVKWGDCQKTLARPTLDKLARLGKELYPQLAERLKSLAPGVPVLISQYPDPTQDAQGATCDDMVDVAGVRAIRRAEAEWMIQGVLRPLNQMIAAMARRHGWRLVSGAEAGFHGHGYCAEEQRWVVTLEDSQTNQLDRNGTLHPNVLGYQFIAGLVKPILRSALYAAKK